MLVNGLLIMPFHRKVKRRTIGKEPRKMAHTILANVTTTPIMDEITIPTVFASGVGTADVLETADTRRTVSPNSIIKYINLKFQIAVRKDVSPANPGWMEYAIVIRDELQATPVIDAAFAANFGTQTIGDIATNLFRDKCIWTGCAAISAEVPTVVPVTLKIPDKFCKQKRGMSISFVIAFRSSNSADVTSSMRLIYSHNYKCYL